MEELEIKEKELVFLEEEIAVLRLNKWNILRLRVLKKIWKASMLRADIRDLKP